MEKLYKLTNVKNENAKFQQFLNSGILSVNAGDGAYVTVAGGALRSFIDPTEDPNDFDIFIVGDSPALKQKLIWFCDSLYESVFRCPQELMFTYKTPFGKLQIICPKVYNNMEHLLDSFDLTPSRASFNGTCLYIYKSFIYSVKKKVLALHKVSFPLATMNRIYKYKGYGYSVYQVAEDFLREVISGEFPEDDMFRHYID